MKGRGREEKKREGERGEEKRGEEDERRIGERKRGKEKRGRGEERIGCGTSCFITFPPVRSVNMKSSFVMGVGFSNQTGNMMMFSALKGLALHV